MHKNVIIYFLIALIICIIIGYFIFFRNDNVREELVIPVIADLTGPIAIYGDWAVKGMTIAIEEINLNGGIDGKQLVLKIEDGQSNPKTGVSAFNNLKNLYRPSSIIVATNTSTVMACSPIANNAKIVLFTPISSGSSVTDAGDFVFRNRVSALFESSEMARYAIKKFHLKKIAAVVINNDAGPGYIDAFKKVLESSGGVLTECIFLDQDKTDFRTQIYKIKNTNPEAVFLALTVKEAGIFIKQSEELGFQPKWLSITTIQSPQIFEIAGKASNGLVFVSEGGDPSNPKYSEFVLKYKKSFRNEPAMNALNAYDAIYILAPMIAKGMKGSEIRNKLYSIKNYRGIGGILTFDKNGDASKPLNLMVVKNQKFIKFE